MRGGGNFMSSFHPMNLYMHDISSGLYENSGDWLYETGLPGKSGVSGGMVVVSPGKGGLGCFAPPLDEAGNSVKGQLVTKFLSQELGLNLFASEPTVKVV